MTDLTLFRRHGRRHLVAKVSSYFTVPHANRNGKPRLSNGLIFLALPVVLLIVAACARIGAPEGWSGGVVVDDTLYMGTEEGEVLALDLTSGETLRPGAKPWRFELPERKGEERERTIYGTPAISDDTVYVGGYDSTLYALSLDLDEIKGIERVDGPIVGGPAVADNLVIVGSSDGNLYAFDVGEEKEKSRITFTEKWKFPTGHKVWSPPAVADGVVYFGSLDHNVYAVTLQDGSQVWKFETEGAVVAAPLVAGGRVFVGSFDRVFYAIDAETGDEVWRFDGASNWFWGQAVAKDGTVFAPSLDGNLYALDMDTGRLRWTLETDGPIVGSPAIVFDMIAVPSADGRIRLATLRDGDEVGDCNIGEEIRTSLVEKEGFIYFGARDRSIRALRIKPSGNPDEAWVRFTDKGDPEPENRVLAC